MHQLRELTVLGTFVMGDVESGFLEEAEITDTGSL
jgi:hypothetical protein